MYLPFKFTHICDVSLANCGRKLKRLDKSELININCQPFFFKATKCLPRFRVHSQMAGDYFPAVFIIGLPEYGLF